MKAYDNCGGKAAEGEKRCFCCRSENLPTALNQLKRYKRHETETWRFLTPRSDTEHSCFHRHHDQAPASACDDSSVKSSCEWHCTRRSPLLRRSPERTPEAAGGTLGFDVGLGGVDGASEIDCSRRLRCAAAVAMSVGGASFCSIRSYCVDFRSRRNGRMTASLTLTSAPLGPEMRRLKEPMPDARRLRRTS